MNSVDILIPIHGHGKFLVETLKSVQQQTYSGQIRVICALDRAESQVLETLVTWQDRIDILVLQSRAPGISNALNTALDVSNADFVFRLDSDDLMDPKRIESQVKEMISGNLLILGSNALIVNQDGVQISQLRMPLDPDSVRATLDFANPFVHSAVCFKRSQISTTLRYRKFYEPAEDFDFWLRILEYGQGQNLPAFLTRYRIHDEQISVKNRRRQIIAREAALLSAKIRKAHGTELNMVFDSIDAWYNDRELGPSFVKKIQIAIESKFSNRTSGRRMNYMLFGIVNLIIRPKRSLKRILMVVRYKSMRNFSFL